MRGSTFITALLAALVGSAGGFAADSPPAGKVPGRWAVLVGVDDYSEIRKLRFAGNDQRALAEQLIASGFPEDQVFLLHDKAEDKKYLPFRANIEKQLELVLGTVSPGDLVIVGFSGHGVQLEGKSYLCPEDTQIDKLGTTMIPLEDVYGRMAKCRASLKLLIVDACRNDILPAGRRSVVLSRSLGEFDGVKDQPPEGILLLSSCGSGQASIEDEQFGHGVFMHYMLEGLKGKAANAEGGVSLAGLYDYASLQTKKYVARKFNGFQTPALKGEINGPFEICLASSSRPAPEPTRTPSGGEAKTLTNSIGMKLVLIPSGEFMMGSADYFNNEKPVHRVRITKPFYLGAHEVTVGQFRQFVSASDYKTDAEKGNKPGAFGLNAERGTLELNEKYLWRNVGYEQTDAHPVVNVSWNDAVAFCDWLSKKEGKSYRLPTEAQWEYACRAGTTTVYSSGDEEETLAQVGNVADATAKVKFANLVGIRASDGYVFTAPVGRFRPNAFGLYDMHGNVLEWCEDWWQLGYYADSPSDDPSGPSSGKDRVYRGGGWHQYSLHCRSASRFRLTPRFGINYLGFRVSRVAE